MNMPMVMIESHFFGYCSFLVSFEMGKWESLNFGPIFRVVLGILGPLYFHMNFRINSSITAKNLTKISDMRFIESVEYFVEYTSIS